MEARSPAAGIHAAPPSDVPPASAALRYHFSGIAGAGMNPLAQLMRARGHHVQGSDRSLDQGKNEAIARRLRELGIEQRLGLERLMETTHLELDEKLFVNTQ